MARSGPSISRGRKTVTCRTCDRFLLRGRSSGLELFADHLPISAVAKTVAFDRSISAFFTAARPRRIYTDFPTLCPALLLNTTGKLPPKSSWHPRVHKEVMQVGRKG